MPRLVRLLFALALATTASAARSATLADSTVREAWRLENGLEVRTTHVPGGAGVSITVAYRAGSGYEPAAQEGLSALLAELQFMSAAGDVPERTREELPSLRPLGWEVRPGARLVRFTEIATHDQLPGVLQQVAKRMAGVTVAETDVRTALANVRRDAGARLFGSATDALYWRTAAMARGLSDERLVRAAGLHGLDRLAARDVAPWLKRWYHPGNASLAIAGDLTGYDVRAIVGSLFAPLAGGPALPDTVRVTLQGAKRTVPWKDLAAPAGAIAVTGPALTDSLHPAFFLGMIITGPAITESWGPPKPPHITRFQYSLIDEPELVRFYPPVRADASDPDLLAGALYEQLMVVGGQNVMGSILNRVKRSVAWLMGGELPRELKGRMQADAGGLGTLSSGMATRALLLGDGFWADYLARFDRMLIGHNYFYEWISAPEHQSTLLLTPAR